MRVRGKELLLEQEEIREECKNFEDFKEACKTFKIAREKLDNVEKFLRNEKF